MIVCWAAHCVEVVTSCLHYYMECLYVAFINPLQNKGRTMKNWESLQLLVQKSKCIISWCDNVGPWHYQWIVLAGKVF